MNKSAVNPTRNPFRKGTRTVKTIQGSCIVARHSWGRLQIWTDKNISWFRNRELGGWVFSSMSKDFVLGSARTSHYLEGCLRSALGLCLPLSTRWTFPSAPHLRALRRKKTTTYWKLEGGCVWRADLSLSGTRAYPFNLLCKFKRGKGW